MARLELPARRDVRWIRNQLRAVQRGGSAAATGQSAPATDADLAGAASLGRAAGVADGQDFKLNFVVTDVFGKEKSYPITVTFKKNTRPEINHRR